MRKGYLFIVLALLCSISGFSQYTNVSTYNFTDNTIISNGQSTDGNLLLEGTYEQNSTYGLKMNVDGTIALTVKGSNTIRFLGSSNSGVYMTGSAINDGDLGTSSTTVTNDLSDTYDFVFPELTGATETLDFSLMQGIGTDLYLPQIMVIPAQSGASNNSADENIIYYFDLRDGSIIPNDVNLNGNYTISEGLFQIACGPSNAYGYKGTQHGAILKPGNIITLTVAGNCHIKLGGSAYSKGTVTATSTSGSFETTTLNTLTGNNFDQDGSAVDLYYEGEAGTVELTFAENVTYIPYIEILPVPSNIEFIEYVKKSGIITLNGVDITYTSGESLSANATVSVSEGAVLSANSQKAIISIDLAGNALSSYAPTVTGDIQSVDLSDDESIEITLADNSTRPYTYSITVIDSNTGANGDLEGKTAVWDFGAEQLDDSKYINRLTDSDINAWYDEAIIIGSSATLLPSFVAGELSFIGGDNDRLRTSNTSLTRYDEDTPSGYNGRIYVNSSGATDRYLNLTLSEDDEITVVALSQYGEGLLNFISVSNPENQTDIVNLTNAPADYKFVAKTQGTYRLYDTQDKPSYCRIYRKNAEYAFVSGAIDITEASDITDGYSIAFKNEAGKVWNVSSSSGAYTVNLPIGYTYSLSLEDANGYIISTSRDLTVDETSETLDISIEKVTLNTLSGTVTGLNNDLAALSLTFSAVNTTQIYIPEVVLDNTTGDYSVELEPDVQYIVTAEGVNDYEMLSNVFKITEDATQNLVFTSKATYAITYSTINTATLQPLTTDQLDDLQITFTNMNEEGYIYTFGYSDNILLRDGIYNVTCTGIDDYPLELASTTTLNVDGAIATLELQFNPVTRWSFNEEQFTASAYKGLLFSTEVTNDQTKGYLEMEKGSTLTVPISAGQKLRIVYYNVAGFTIDGGNTVYVPVNSLGTKQTTDTVDYLYTGTDGTVTIAMTDGDTDFTQIEILDIIPYSPVIYVGEDKEYTTINGALDAIKLMDSRNNQRVTIMIDPGNYEEMLVIDQDSVSLVNASPSPSIDLANNGIDIDPASVRVTSYYGYGYNYYSMGNDQKWNADVLAQNQSNGDLSYENQSGTTNGSYWNATVVVYADGFVAENIIFENSFNQYISKKESEDTVVEWADGGKGTRPTDIGNISVQEKSFIERAAAFAIASGDQTILNNCRIVGHQDTFYGQNNSRVAIYKGAMMGGTDYIFGGMVAAFYQTDFALATSDDNNDVAYITAAKQSSGRGYLMYECNILSAEPGIDISSAYDYSKPGYFGRPWAEATSEVVFFNTTIAECKNTNFSGQSLIEEEGWLNSLNGESSGMYEYQSIEMASGIENTSNRVTWATTSVNGTTLNDGTEISLYNFTKGNDGWDPFAILLAPPKTYAVTLTTVNSATENELTADQLANLKITFTNINDEEIVYTYIASDDIALSDGTYAITYTGLDQYPLELNGPIENLTIAGAESSMELTFNQVTNWSFDDTQFTGMSYKGLIFSSESSNNQAFGDIDLLEGTTISVPIEQGQTLEVVYYYSAAFTIDTDETVHTTINSTASKTTTDTVKYVYNGINTSVDINVLLSTTYITNIKVYYEKYSVNVTTTNSDTDSDLTQEQTNALNITFTNVDDESITYTFNTMEEIELVNGTYSISYEGLETYPLDLASIPTLTVDGEDVALNLVFHPVTNWSFDDSDFTANAYKGLLFSSEVSNNQALGNIGLEEGTTISVPIKTGDMLEVVYNYSAAFKIGAEEQLYTTSGSTASRATTDTVKYVYKGTETYIDISILLTTTYITNIKVTDALYNVSINTTDSGTGNQLTSEQLGALQLTFTNIYNDAELYTFNAQDNIELKNGTYAITFSGIGQYPIEMNELSDLTIDGSDEVLELTFTPVSNWTFDDTQFSSNSYKGLLFSKEVTNDQHEGHIGLQEGTTISVPIEQGQELEVIYYYTAGFSIDGNEEIYTTINSTALKTTTDTVKYVYSGTASYIDINVRLSTTFITNIKVAYPEVSTDISTNNQSEINIYSYQNEVVLTNVSSKTLVNVYTLSGQVIKQLTIYNDERFVLPKGYYLIYVNDVSGKKVQKVMIY